MIETTAANFETEVLKWPGEVLVDFYSQGCSPCRYMALILESIEKTNLPIKIVKFDAGENQQVAAQYRVSAVPTFVLFSHGQVKKQITGSRSEKSFVAWLQSQN